MRRPMIRSLRLALTAALATTVFISSAPLEAEPLEAWGEAAQISPFEIEVLRAELLEDGQGEPSLEMDFLVHNRSEEVIAAVAWALEVYDEGGGLLSSVGGARNLDIPRGESVEVTQTFDAATAKAVPPTGHLVVRVAGGSYSSNGICAGSAQTEEEACEQWEFACESLCGEHNPLVGGPGVARPPECGSCIWMHDDENNCDYLSCQATCICASWDFPPYLPAGPGPWAEDPTVLPAGACGELVGPEDGLFFFRN